MQDVLSQLDGKERLEKLEETFQSKSVCDDYRRILAMLR